MLKTKFSVLIIFLITSVFWGCSDKINEPETLNPDNFFGGLTSRSEVPAFGDADLISEGQSNIAFEDPMLSDSDIIPLIQDDQADCYHLRFVWGRLRLDSAQTDLTDWTGSLSVNRGGVVLKHLIHWELNQDFILPRTDRKLVEWISFTSVHNDGLALDVLIPAVRPIFDTTFVTDPVSNDTIDIIIDTTFPESEPVEVVFTTEPYTRVFSLDEIAELDTVVSLDDGNSVAISGIKADRRICPSGFLTGCHQFDGERRVFKGSWLNKEGRIIGHYRGFIEQDETGRNMFVGKWIDEQGRFRGFIRGVLEDFPESGNGFGGRFGEIRFAGKIYNENREEIGQLNGFFRSNSNGNSGFMAGRWRFKCGDYQNRLFDGSMMDFD